MKNHIPPLDIGHSDNVRDNAAVQNFFSSFKTERTAPKI